MRKAEKILSEALKEKDAENKKSLSQKILEEQTDKKNAPKKAETKKKAIEDLDSKGVEIIDDSAVKWSAETWNSTDKKKLRSDLVKAGYSGEQADAWIADLDSIAAAIFGDPNRLDYIAADNQVFLKPNQEYKYTLDASTLCAKRLLYQGTFNAIQHKLQNTVLTSDDLIKLQTMLKDMGYQSPCGVCYIELSIAIMKDGKKVAYAKKSAYANDSVWKQIKAESSIGGLSPQDRVPRGALHSERSVQPVGKDSPLANSINERGAESQAVEPSQQNNGR